ncbi:hypothetical protein HJ526_19125 [Donghicola sp. C2-DW-16]|uniref:Plasmid recombination enzyme n=1 Tax=Donghicola mangrovi TaxID=2729614 RepID=A0ABX2PLH2_9RHOB|nr:hypothetical protein [Donghicola mangrovi]NVO29537.1 hypothetical protein [Donghicola mangrovi]
MSVCETFPDPTPVAAVTTYPVVLRMTGVFPHQLARMVFHDNREGGDLEHVDADQTVHNKLLHGAPTWAKDLQAEIDTVSQFNHENAVEALRAKSRQKQAEALLDAGVSVPWRATKHGPIRDGILTVNKAWFGGTGRDSWDQDRVAAFEARSLEFLQVHFPGTQLRHVSAHEDEEAYHIHFAVAVWVELTSKNKGQQFMLQPSANPLIRHYETAQTIVGEFFSELGLTRGERRAEARREARAKGEEGPERRTHVPPSTWRAEQFRTGKEAGEAALQTSEKEAEKVIEAAKEEARRRIEDARELGAKTQRKSRKRAVKEAKARKAAVEKQAKALEVEQARLARAKAEQAEAEALLAKNAKTLVADSLKVAAKLDRARVEVKELVQQKDGLEAACDALEGRKKALGAEVDGLRVQKADAESLIEKAKVAGKEIERNRAKIKDQTVDLENREAALESDKAAFEKGVQAGDKVLQYLEDVVLAFDVERDKWQKGENWEAKADSGDDVVAHLDALPKPLFRFIRKAIKAVKAIFEKERAKIEKEWEDVRDAAQTIAEARERLGMEEDQAVSDMLEENLNVI